MKVLLAQMNFLVGDMKGNVDRMIRVLKGAESGVDLVVFPELATIGYPPLDLINQDGFMEEQTKELYRLLDATSETAAHVIVGCVAKNKLVGKPLKNSALLMYQGRIVHQQDKALLPTYDIFDEARYFEPGETEPVVFTIGDKKVGFLICEDCWNDKAEKPYYAARPVKRLVQVGRPDYIVTLNASPCGIGKDKVRIEMFKAMAQDYGVGFVYVNQVGANDDVIFDGSSFVMDKHGNLAQKMSRFKEEWSLFDSDEESSTAPPMYQDKIPFIYDALVLGIRDYVHKCGFKSVVVGSSGGIDSAVVLALARAALGQNAVKAITMPSYYSSEGSVTDSDVLCKNLGIELFNVPITGTLEAMKRDFLHGIDPNVEHTKQTLEWENTQARIRGMNLMAFSNRYGALVLSTGNKSEMSVGYCTLYGDMCGGLAVLADVYKTEVFDLARYINARAFFGEVIPTAIIDKAPSAELAPDQKDTDALPPYPVLDRILRFYIEGEQTLVDDPEHVATPEEMAAYAKAKGIRLSELYPQIVRKVNGAEFKRKQAPPGLRVRSQAFGAGRRLPVARKF